MVVQCMCPRWRVFSRSNISARLARRRVASASANCCTSSDSSHSTTFDMVMPPMHEERGHLATRSHRGMHLFCLQATCGPSIF